MKPFDRVAAQGLGADFATRELDRTEDIIRAFCAEEGARLAPPHETTAGAVAESPETPVRVSAYSEQTSPNGHALEAAKWGFGFGFVVGLGAALIVFVGSILVIR